MTNICKCKFCGVFYKHTADQMSGLCPRGQRLWNTTKDNDALTIANFIYHIASLGYVLQSGAIYATFLHGSGLGHRLVKQPIILKWLSEYGATFQQRKENDANYA